MGAVASGPHSKAEIFIQKHCIFPLLLNFIISISFILSWAADEQGQPPAQSHRGDVSHDLTARIQQSSPNLPLLTKFLFFSALFFAESLKFPSALLT